MSKLKSIVVEKERIYCPGGNSTHREILETIGIKDISCEPDFVMIDITPPKRDIFTPIERWIYKVEQDWLPKWYVEEVYKSRAYEALNKWAKEHIFVNLNDFKIKNSGSYYLKNCRSATVCNDARVTVWDSTNIIAYDDATLEAWGDTSITAWGDVKIIAKNNTRITAHDNVSVEAWDNSIITARDNANITTWEHLGSISRQFSLYENAILRNYYTNTIYHNGNWTLMNVGRETKQHNENNKTCQR